MFEVKYAVVRALNVYWCDYTHLMADVAVYGIQQHEHQQ